ncbi:MAG: hypothetical protein H0V92_12590 [Pseudonocardiales bacterium]|nr:hypothetical protein [Pseudonocardiales bacterium]
MTGVLGSPAIDPHTRRDQEQVQGSKKEDQNQDRIHCIRDDSPAVIDTFQGWLSAADKLDSETSPIPIDDLQSRGPADVREWVVSEEIEAYDRLNRGHTATPIRSA